MKRPNIVLILSDDQGNWAMNCAGNDEIITPNLNRIADEGAVRQFLLCLAGVFSGKTFPVYRQNSLPARRGGLDRKRSL